MNHLIVTGVFLLLLVATIADAAPIYANTSNSVSGAAGLTVSATDLVNQGRPTLSGAYTSNPAPNFGAGTVNDGQAANSVDDAAWYKTTGQLPATLTFNFNVGVNTLGYDITQINSFAGWEGGGTQTYANQKFTVEYSVVGDAAWLPLAAVDYSPFTSTSSSTAAYSQSTITDSAGVLATGVDALRFVYSDPTVSGGDNRGMVLQEIDVQGVPTPSGPDTTAPTLTNSAIVDNRSGTPVEENQMVTYTVTYTVTFSEDMDAATFSADDFGNAGTATAIIGAIAETSPGVFSVAVTPTSTGTLQLHVRAGATLTDVAGNSLVTNSAIVDDTTITVTAAVPDTTAPTPNPMTFATAPHATTATSIAMAATPATDPAGVEYFFDETSGNPGGTDSGWQSSASYVDTGLTTGLPYAYTVTARDLSAKQNPTDPSVIASATAEIPPDPPSVITLTSPASRYIVQRSASNTGAIPITGTYTSVPGEIQARAVVMAGTGNSGTTTDWQTINPAPAGGSFTGTLTGVPAGGWYQLEVRGVVGGLPGTATVREKIGVGDIYVTAGQSNSANNGSGGYTCADDRVCARTAVTGANWIAAADPIPVASASGGSVWTRLGDLLAAADNIPIGFLAVGVGATQVSQWVPGQSHYNNRLKPSVQSFPAGGFRAVLWHQGESDSLASVTAATHASRLKLMIDQSRIDAGWAVPWYLAEAAFHPSSNLSQEEPVTAGQRQMVHGDPLVFLGPDTDPFHLEDAAGGKLNDSVHFNAAGLLDHARQWRDILRGTTTVTPRNGNFEDNRNASITSLALLADGVSHIVTTTSNNDSPLVLGWHILSADGLTAAAGSNGFFNPSTGNYAGAVDSSNGGVLPNMNGRHVAMLDGGSANNYFLHTTRATLQPNTAYTLNVAIGVRDNPAAFGSARLDLLADGQVIATASFGKAALDTLRGGDASGHFTNVSLSHVTGATVTPNQTLALRIVKTGGAGTVLDFDNVRLSAQTGYAAFQVQHWGSSGHANAGPVMDPDADGSTNLLEYAFGSDPKAPNRGYLPKRSIGGGNLALTYQRNDAAEAYTLQTGQWSVDLSNWEDIAPVLVNENAAEADDMQIVIPLANAVDGRLFGRLKVSEF